jgi:hypothetical protein
VAATARVGSSRGCGAAYKGRVDRLGVRAKATRRARAAAGELEVESGRDTPRSAIIGGGHLSSAARGGGGGASGGDCWAGWAATRCWAAAREEQGSGLGRRLLGRDAKLARGQEL